jgi:signal transduction histidine kinase
MSNPTEDLAATVERLRADYGSLVQRLESNQREFQRLARSVYRVQEDERRRLARELHDGLGQNLTALKHQLALVAETLGPDRPELLAQIQAGIGLCAQSLADTRQLSRLLRPQVLDDLGLEPALQWLARTLGASTGMAIRVDAEPQPGLDGEIQTLLFRIAQEALTNALKHAQANQAEITLRARAGWITLGVWDDGRGFDVAAAQAAASTGAGSGLGGMRDRVALHGGRLLVESRPGGGTRLQAAVPLAGEAGEPGR